VVEELSRHSRSSLSVLSPLLLAWTLLPVNLPFRTPSHSIPPPPSPPPGFHRHLILGAIYRVPFLVVDFCEVPPLLSAFAHVPFYTLLQLGTACPLLSSSAPVPLLDDLIRFRTITLRPCSSASRLLFKTASHAPGRSLEPRSHTESTPLPGLKPLQASLSSIPSYTQSYRELTAPHDILRP
jgi:hypothetical protein